MDEGLTVWASVIVAIIGVFTAYSRIYRSDCRRHCWFLRPVYFDGNFRGNE